MDRIPVFRPLLEADEMAAVSGAIELGWLGMGSFVGEFEEALKRVIGAADRHVVAVSTGHAAIHLSLLAAGVGPGDEVITPSLNNIADLQAILATGAQPVFCDVDPQTLCISVPSAERMVGPETRAIIATDYFCHLADHDAVDALARPRAIRVIHDAAHSLGSRYKGQPVGSHSDTTIFSFDAVKTVTCIDGGAIVVDTEEQALVLREMRLIGMSQSAEVMYRNQRAWTYDVTRLGFRYHMANLHAALGLSQLEKLDVITETRRAACRRYNERLSVATHIAVPPSDFSDVTPFLYYVRVELGQRDEFRAFLQDNQIDTGVHWQPGHDFTLFSDCRRDELPVTEIVAQEIVSLPLHSKMPTSLVDHICDVVLDFDRGLD